MFSWNYKDRSYEGIGKEIDVELIQALQDFIDAFEQRYETFSMSEHDRELILKNVYRVLTQWKDYNLRKPHTGDEYTQSESFSSEISVEVSHTVNPPVLRPVDKKIEQNVVRRMSITNILDC